MRSCPSCGAIYSARPKRCGIDGSVLIDSDEDPLIGRTLDRYQVIQTLGAGGMGSVYRAEHIVLHHEYALKVLFGELASDEKLVARFTREAKYLSQIAHDNVVKVVDFGTTSAGLTFLVMEYLHGLSLAEMIRLEGQMSVKDVAVIAKQIFAGLHAVHEAGFVHRDVKPGNIMLVHQDGRDCAKILDFGLASIVDDGAKETKLTKSGQTVGTPSYMAPEQIRAGEIGPAADVYSMGVVMYEALTGDSLYAGTSSEVMIKHLVDPIPVMTVHNGMETVIEKCLAKKPEDRLTIPQLLSLLSEWAGDQTLDSSVQLQAISDPDLRGRTSEAALASAPLRTAPDISLSPSAASVRPKNRRLMGLFAGMALITGVVLGYALIRGSRNIEVQTVPKVQLDSAPDVKHQLNAQQENAKSTLPSKVSQKVIETASKPVDLPLQNAIESPAKTVLNQPKPDPVKQAPTKVAPVKNAPRRDLRRTAKPTAEKRISKKSSQPKTKAVARSKATRRPRAAIPKPTPSTTASSESRPAGRLNVVAVFAKRPRPVELFVDGKSRGMTPLRLKLRPGKYKIEIRPVGIAAQSRTVEIQSGKTQPLVFDLGAGL
jgi:serine/threonine protein kinase